jgi:histidinol-phosphate aminotransferase
MDQTIQVNHKGVDELLEQVADRTMVAGSRLLMFRDYTEALSDLLRLVDLSAGDVLVAGHCSPDVAIAADKAGLTVRESLGASPFCGDPTRVLQAVSGRDQVVFAANPNRITGAGFALSDLGRIAEAVPDGLLIVDEHYFDYCGVTSVPLLERHSNLVIMRSFAAGFCIGCESGFLVAHQALIRHLRAGCHWQRISATLRKLVMSTFSNDAAQGKRLKVVHNESLRIATTLTRLGIQNRITPTDFLLIRVADPARVGNFLAARGVPIENLDGYPEMNNYIRYTIQSEKSNDVFLRAFDKMPVDYYRMKDADQRALTLRSRGRGKHESSGNPWIRNLVPEREAMTELKGSALTQE